MNVVKIVINKGEVYQICRDIDALLCLQHALLPADKLIDRKEIRGFHYVVAINDILFKAYQLSIDDIKFELNKTDENPSLTVVDKFLIWNNNANSSNNNIDMNNAQSMCHNCCCKVITFRNCAPGIILGRGTCQHVVIKDVQYGSLAMALNIPCLMHVHKINGICVNLLNISKLWNNSSNGFSSKSIRHFIELHLYNSSEEICNAQEHSKSEDTGDETRQFCELKLEDKDKLYGFSLGYLSSGEHIIERVDPNKPAELCGLKTGDRLLEINGTDVDELTHSQIVKLIKSSMMRGYSLYILLESKYDVFYEDLSLKSTAKHQPSSTTLIATTQQNSITTSKVFGHETSPLAAVRRIETDSDNDLFYHKFGFDIVTNQFNQHFVAAIKDSCSLASLGLVLNDQILLINGVPSNEFTNLDLKKEITRKCANRLMLTVVNHKNTSGIFSNVYPIQSNKIVSLDSTCKYHETICIQTSEISETTYKHEIKQTKCKCLLGALAEGDIMMKVNDQSVQNKTNSQVIEMLSELYHSGKPSELTISTPVVNLYALPTVELREISEDKNELASCHYRLQQANENPNDGNNIPFFQFSAAAPQQQNQGINCCDNSTTTTSKNNNSGKQHGCKNINHNISTMESKTFDDRSQLSKRENTNNDPQVYPAYTQKSVNLNGNLNVYPIFEDNQDAKKGTTSLHSGPFFIVNQEGVDVETKSYQNPDHELCNTDADNTSVAPATIATAKLTSIIDYGNDLFNNNCSSKHKSNSVADISNIFNSKASKNELRIDYVHNIIYKFIGVYPNINENIYLRRCTIYKQVGQDIGMTVVRHRDGRVTVQDVRKNSPAFLAGLRNDDMLLEIGNQPIRTLPSCEQVTRRIKSIYYMDSNVDIVIARRVDRLLSSKFSKSTPNLTQMFNSSKPQHLPSCYPPAVLFTPVPRKCTLNLKDNEEIGFVFEYTDDFDCPIITKVVPGSAAHRSGLHLCDMILAFDNTSVQSIDKSTSYMFTTRALQNKYLELLVLTKTAYTQYMQKGGVLFEEDDAIFDYENAPRVCFDEFAPKLSIFRGKALRNKVGISITDKVPNVIALVDKHSPAFKAGIKRNSIIHEINDFNVENASYTFISNVLLQAKNSGELKLLTTDQIVYNFYHHKQIPLNSYLKFLSVSVVDK